MSDMVYISHLISIVNDQKLLDYNRLSQIIRNKKKKHLVRVCSHRALPLAVPRPWVGHSSLDRGSSPVNRGMNLIILKLLSAVLYSLFGVLLLSDKIEEFYSLITESSV